MLSLGHNTEAVPAACPNAIHWACTLIEANASRVADRHPPATSKLVAPTGTSER